MTSLPCAYNKIIQSLQKQNDCIYNSLVAKNIQFERNVIPENLDEKEHVKLLNDENFKLKEIVKANKPIDNTNTNTNTQTKKNKK